MNYLDFLNSEALQKAAEAFLTVFRGRFFCEEPGDRLVYETEDGGRAYTPLEGTAPEKVLQVLQKSVRRETPCNFILTLWPELEYDPALDY